MKRRCGCAVAAFSVHPPPDAGKALAVSESAFKTVLVIPPDYERVFPPLGTPALCAFLKKNSVAARQVDLNILYREFLAKNIKAAIPLNAKLDLLRPLLFEFFSRRLKNRYYSDFLIRDRDPFFPYIPYGNNTNSSFYFCERLLSSPHLWRYLRDEEENTFLRFYREQGVLEKLRGATLLGISIISPSQVVAAFTLGLLVKKYLPRTHVVIGGQWPTLFRKELHRRKDLFRCFDSIIAFEGETPLHMLAEALRCERGIKDIPHLLTKNSVYREPEGFVRGEDMDNLPCPDFGGLPLKKYDTFRYGKSVTLTYESSRGCYWSRCAYCVDLPLPKPLYREKDPELVRRDLRELKRKYKARAVMMGDPGMSPGQMLGISKKLSDAKTKIRWWTMARLDPGFTAKVFGAAAKAGLGQVNFGFESACDRVCDLLHKGNRKKRSERIIMACAKAGIRVDLQTMMGLPDENPDDAMETIAFLIKNRKYISSVTFNTYYLTPANRVYLNPGKYGIKFLKDKKTPFRFFHLFFNLRGMTPQQTQYMQDVYYTLLNRELAEKNTEIAGETRKNDRRGLVSGSAAFSLMGETVSIGYQYDARRGRVLPGGTKK